MFPDTKTHAFRTPAKNPSQSVHSTRLPSIFTNYQPIKQQFPILIGKRNTHTDHLETLPDQMRIKTIPSRKLKHISQSRLALASFKGKKSNGDMTFRKKKQTLAKNQFLTQTSRAACIKKIFNGFSGN